MRASTFRRIARNKYAALVLVTAVLIAVFYAINPNYLSGDNLRNIMYAMSFSGTLVVGMSLLLIAGEVDLASGAEACFGGVIAALLIQAGLPWPLALLLAILFGACCGYLNAFFVNKLNFMGFIATIGIMGVYNGLIRVVTNSKNVPIADQSFWSLGQVRVLGALPLPFAIMLGLMVVYGCVLHFTEFGRNIYMIGGNKRAARLCGINQQRIVAVLYVNNGALAALAGVVLASRMHNASPDAGSTGALDAITAAVLGGVSFVGGVGGMAGGFLGILLLTAFGAGLTATGLQSYWQIVAQGALLILALSVDFFSENARRRGLKRAEAAADEAFAAAGGAGGAALAGGGSGAGGGSHAGDGDEDRDGYK
jgi:ribose/xylose/arabinose/galactoside ABC-type transport system permease subunit